MDKLLDTTDKCKQRINKLIKNNKKKILRINIDEAFLESNLIEMPFISLQKSKEIVSVVEYNWSDSNGIKHEIKISGSGQYGVPTAFEYDVLIALFRLYAKKNRIEFSNDLDINNEDELILRFSFNDVAKEMGYDDPGGKDIKRIKKAINILIETTIYNKNCAFYDISNKKYIEENEVGFHIIGNAEFYSLKTNKKDNSKDLNSVTFGKFFCESIKKGYFKYFNYNTYKELNSPIAKRLFTLLTKWKNNRSFLEVNYSTLYDRIPLDTDMDKRYKKASVKRACEYLVNVGFLNSYDIGTEKIKFNFENIVSEIENKKENDNKHGFNTLYKEPRDVNNRLKEIGLTPDEINDRIMLFVTDFEYLKALLRYSEVRNVFGEIDNLKDFVLKGLDEKYEINEKYYDEIKQ